MRLFLEPIMQFGFSDLVSYPGLLEAFPVDLACTKTGLEGTKYRPQNERVQRSSKSIPRQQLSHPVD